MPHIDQEKVQRFAAIFDGRKDARGLVHGECARGEVTLEHYRRHLAGEESLGVYPLLPDSTCRFGAVDIDRKDPALARAVYEALLAAGLPSGVHMEQSRGKGYHVWVFVDEPIPASEMQTLLRRAVRDAGLPEKTEVFPKQSDAGAVQFGNYINLPYFGETDGPRMVLTSGTMEPMPLTRFLTLCWPASHATVRSVVHRIEDSAKPTTGLGLQPSRDNWIVDGLAGTGEGERNDMAAKLTGYFKRAGIPEDVTLAILDDWAARCVPPFDRGELKRVVTGIYQRYTDAPIEGPADRFEAVSLERFFAETPDRIEWLVEPFIPAGGMVAMAGKPASGKTWLALDLAVAIASGKPWLRKFDVTQGPVLLIDEESPGPILRSRLDMLMRSAGENRQALPIKVAWRKGLNLSSQRSVDQLKETIADVQPVLVIIDAFAEVHRESENVADEVAKVFNRLREAGKPSNPAFLVLHHNRKDSGTFRGSSHIEATLDTMLSVSISDDDTSKVEHAKARCSARVASFGVRRIIREDEGTAQLLLVAAPASEIGDHTNRRTGPKVRMAKDALADFFGFRDGWVPKDEIRDALANDDIDEASLNAALGHLEDEAKLERRKDPDNGTKKQFRWKVEQDDAPAMLTTLSVNGHREVEE